MDLLPDDLPQVVNTGIMLINQGLYFRAHEVLETEWLIEKSTIRNFYRGLIQLSAALYHLERGNTKGAIKVLNLAEDNLTPFEHTLCSIDLSQLLTDIQKLRSQISGWNEAGGSTKNQGLFHITISAVK